VLRRPWGVARPENDIEFAPNSLVDRIERSMERPCDFAPIRKLAGALRFLKVGES
jgi:hypothetical protein